MRQRKHVIVAIAAFIVSPIFAASPTITIDTTKVVGKISPVQHGLMTEEINHSYDGGLYAELIQNRVFKDDAKEPKHWSVVNGDGGAATISLDKSQPLNNALPVSLKLEVTKAPAGAANDGYWGFPIKPNMPYRASFYARAGSDYLGTATVSLLSEDGKATFASAQVTGITPKWKSFQATLVTQNVEPTTHAKFAITFDQPGTIWLDLVSLFPPTYKDQPNGFRADLLQMLIDMKPEFLRFPGGNYVEGDRIEDHFDWKKTIGPLVDRPGHMAPWSYRSTDGMGLLEFLMWCQDMNAEPLLAVYGGYSLRGQHVNPGADLEPYVQDALDEIEYVTDDATSTKWGAERAKNGHPEPFKLTYVEINNEDFFDKSGSYDARFTQFYDAIKKKYPSLKVISTVGNEHPESQRVHSRTPDAVDEHYYRPADEFVKDSEHYEKYPRNGGPEIFVGEWASYEDPKIKPWDRGARQQPPTPSMKAAIGDAAWMCDMERNADIVKMQCYAPLLVRVEPGARQWRPNLIGYDGLHVYGSPSYYAIQMFNQNLGDEAISISRTDTPLLSSASRDSQTGEIIVKIVNPEPTEQPVTINLKGVNSVASSATAITLTAPLDAINTIEEPKKVAPVMTTISDVKPTFEYKAPGNSVVVLKIVTKG